MSKYMTQKEIEEEQELIRKQSLNSFNFTILEETAINSSVVSDEDGHNATPLDLLNSNNYVDKKNRDSRYNTCLGCEKLFKPTKSCKECGCFMALKTWLKDASCPLQKW